MATVHCCTAVPLRHHKLKDGLLGRPDIGLVIQEAILEEQLLLGLNIGSGSFLIENRQESSFEGFPGSPKVLHHLVEHRVILLFYLPIYDVSGGQFRCPGGNSLLWIGLYAFWIRADSYFSPLLQRCDGVDDPWTKFAATILAIGVPFLISSQSLVLFLNTTGTLLLPVAKVA